MSRPQNNDPYQQLLVTNPGKGLNNLISNNLIDDHESPDLMNIKFVEAGSPAKSDGFTLALTTATLPRGLGYFNDFAGSAKYLLTVDGTELKDVISQTAYNAISFSSTGTIFMTEVDGSMAIWDGVNGGAEFTTGAVLSRPGTMPKAKFSIYWAGVHAAAGVAGQESRLYVTGAPSLSTTLATISAFQFTNASGVLATVQGVPGATVFQGAGAQYIDVAPGDSDQITGLAVFQSNLIIFKERSIWQFSFDTSGNPVLQMITQAYGCVGFKSIQRVDNDVFFLTRNGIYVLGYEPNFLNVIRTNELSARIHPIIETINPSNFLLATSMFHQYVYYLGVPAGGVSANNLTLTYDRRYQAWSQLNHIMPESFCLYDDVNNNETMYFTSSTTNQIFRITPYIYNSNGSAISAYWYSKSFDLGNFNVYKRWVDCAIFFRELVGTVLVTFYTDNGTLVDTFTIADESVNGIGNDQFGAFPFGGNPPTNTGNAITTNNVPYRFQINQKSRTMQVQIANTNTNETFEVLGVAFRYRPYSSFTWNSALKIYN